MCPGSACFRLLLGFCNPEQDEAGTEKVRMAGSCKAERKVLNVFVFQLPTWICMFVGESEVA